MRMIDLWLVMAMVMASAAAAAAADADPFIGTWEMKAASGGLGEDLPQHMVIVMDAAAGGVHYRSEATRGNGRTATAEYTAEYDGQLAMVSGDAGLLAPVALKRIDRNTVEASYKRGFQTIASSRRVVSPDGATMTITTSSTADDGRKVVNVGVFERLRRPP